MLCPNCKENVVMEIANYVMNENYHKFMPQLHGYCEDCDLEFVRTGRSPRVRVLDSGNNHLYAGGILGVS